MKIRYFLFVLMLLALLGLVAMWSLLSGEVNVEWHSLPTVLRQPDSIEYAVLMNLRIPRLLLAFGVGASLGLSGVILQGIYRNPLVEPFTLGISGGASLGVAFAIVSGLGTLLGNYSLPMFGFLGALATIFIVYFIGMKQGRANANRMLLTGVMITFVSSSFLMFLLSIATDENLRNILFWTMGSLEEPDTGLTAWMLGGAFVVWLLAHFYVHALNAMRLGEAEAMHLGVNVSATVKVLFVLTSLLTGICVSVAGIIGFVGLVVPHLVRWVSGSDFRIQLTTGFLGGGLFLMVCDVLARTLISPNELPVGVLTGMIGGVLFILIISGNKRTWKR